MNTNTLPSLDSFPEDAPLEKDPLLDKGEIGEQATSNEQLAVKDTQLEGSLAAIRKFREQISQNSLLSAVNYENYEVQLDNGGSKTISNSERLKEINDIEEKMRAASAVEAAAPTSDTAPAEGNQTAEEPEKNAPRLQQELAVLILEQAYSDYYFLRENLTAMIDTLKVKFQETESAEQKLEVLFTTREMAIQLSTTFTNYGALSDSIAKLINQQQSDTPEGLVSERAIDLNERLYTVLGLDKQNLPNRDANQSLVLQHQAHKLLEGESSKIDIQKVLLFLDSKIQKVKDRMATPPQLTDSTAQDGDKGSSSEQADHPTQEAKPSQAATQAEQPTPTLVPPQEGTEQLIDSMPTKGEATAPIKPASDITPDDVTLDAVIEEQLASQRTID